MAPKRRRLAEHENKQVAQNGSSRIKRARRSSVKINCKLFPVVVFAHGAGAPSSSEWMIRWKNLLADAINAVEVVTFDYPYIAGRKPPPKAEKLVEFHSDLVKKIATKYPKHPRILVGKSMVSRVGCIVAAENDIKASVVVCLGYPLKGTKDGLCPLASLGVTKKMKARNSVYEVENDDHSFIIGKTCSSSNCNVCFPNYKRNVITI